jgi:hypothetical protein
MLLTSRTRNAIKIGYWKETFLFATQEILLENCEKYKIRKSREKLFY